MAASKLLFLLPILLSSVLTTAASPVLFQPSHNSSAGPNESSYPNRTIAGVTVIDTPVVRAAHAYAREYSSDFVYNHVMRGWLFGALIWQHHLEQHGNTNITNSGIVIDPLDNSGDFDIEVHAVAALLHDLGWDQTPHSPVISPDRRFEVDGAIASREFLHHHQANVTGGGQLAAEDATRRWDHRRTQLVWDAIALHTTPTIFPYKEPEVQVVGHGILMDFEGPAHGVTQAEYAAVAAQFPRAGFREGVNQTFVWLCASKPQTTYDTMMQPFGDYYVANYSAVGHRVYDMLMNTSD